MSSSAADDAVDDKTVSQLMVQTVVLPTALEAMTKTLSEIVQWARLEAVETRQLATTTTTMPSGSPTASQTMGRCHTQF